MLTSHRSYWLSVNRHCPCEICGKPSWCSINEDSSIAICRRVESYNSTRKVDSAGVEYFVHILKDRNDQNRSLRVLKKEMKHPQSASSSDCNSVYSYILNNLPLTNDHYDNLYNRGLSDENIHRGKYRSLDVKTARTVAKKLMDNFLPRLLQQVPGFYLNKESKPIFCGVPGLLIPVRNDKNEIVALKVRSNKTTDYGKYIYASSKRFGGPGPGAPVHLPIFEHDSIDTIRVTEGELKADVATALTKTLTISIPGVSCWRKVIPTLSYLKPKVVKFAYDSDIKTNKHVARALSDSVFEIKSLGYSVEVETWTA